MFTLTGSSVSLCMSDTDNRIRWLPGEQRTKVSKWCKGVANLLRQDWGDDNAARDAFRQDAGQLTSVCRGAEHALYLTGCTAWSSVKDVTTRWWLRSKVRLRDIDRELPDVEVSRASLLAAMAHILTHGSLHKDDARLVFVQRMTRPCKAA